MVHPSGTMGDASGKPNVPGGSENMGERLPQLRIMSNALPWWSYVSGRTMGDSFSIAGMAGAVSMTNASSPAEIPRRQSCLSARKVRSETKRERKGRTRSRSLKPNGTYPWEIGIRTRRGLPRRRVLERRRRTGIRRGLLRTAPVGSAVCGMRGRDKNEKAELAEGNHLLTDKYGPPLFKS